MLERGGVNLIGETVMNMFLGLNVCSCCMTMSMRNLNLGVD